MSAVHPYIRYAQALILLEYNLFDCSAITTDQIVTEIEKGFNKFRVKPMGIYNGKTSVKYGFCSQEKGDPKSGIFLSPNIISTDMQANNTWKAGHDICADLKNNNNKSSELTMSVAPSSGEYLSFSIRGGIGRGKPKVTFMEQGLSTITTLTPNKPCLQYRVSKKSSSPDIFNIGLIPDLPIDQLKDFIDLFKKMLKSQTVSNLMIGNVKENKIVKKEIVSNKEGKKEKKEAITITYEPKRPLIYKGNFPNPPKSNALGSIALLGAIGEFTKEAEYSKQAKRVLDSLKNSEIYIVKYGGATVFTYNHHVIDLAKECKLKTIIDSLYYSQLYRGKRIGNKEKDFDPNTEYQKFDLFTSRFLQLFNHSAFEDFLAFRAEYPNQVEILFNTYFMKMEKIDPQIVSSARILGKWLNKVAYFAAKAEVKTGSPNYWDELRKVKSKVLVELESSTFSSESGDELIARAVTRAGRLSGLDAPEGAALFMEKTASESIPLESARNLLVAFSRLKNKAEKSETPAEQIDSDNEENEDFNNE
jgi:CRISPR-associated protein Cas8c/Csp2